MQLEVLMPAYFFAVLRFQSLTAKYAEFAKKSQNFGRVTTAQSPAWRPAGFSYRRSGAER